MAALRPRRCQLADLGAGSWFDAADHPPPRRPGAEWV